MKTGARVTIDLIKYCNDIYSQVVDTHNNFVEGLIKVNML